MTCGLTSAGLTSVSRSFTKSAVDIFLAVTVLPATLVSASLRTWVVMVAGVVLPGMMAEASAAA